MVDLQGSIGHYEGLFAAGCKIRREKVMQTPKRTPNAA
jgi:hypothetical protein